MLAALLVTLTSLMSPGPAVSLAADPAERLTFYFPESERSFTRIPSRHLTIATECLKNSPPTCDAYQALNRVSAREIQLSRGNGANPGALACRNVGGKITMGTDLKRNQNSFCLFPDGSLISNGSLYYHARRNDEKKK